jgi:hypothetical protein
MTRFFFTLALAGLGAITTAASGASRGIVPHERVDIRVSVREGEETTLSVSDLSLSGVCRDGRVARMSRSSGTLTFAGIRPGVTRCMFWKGQTGLPVVVEVTVQAADS